MITALLRQGIHLRHGLFFSCAKKKRFKFLVRKKTGESRTNWLVPGASKKGVNSTFSLGVLNLAPRKEGEGASLVVSLFFLCGLEVVNLHHCFSWQYLS